MSRAHFHCLSIAKVRALPDGLAISFAIPDDLRPNFYYTPGQYVTIEASIDGQSVRRTYSICSYHQDKQIEVGIKRIENGVFSNFALGLKTGDQLNVMPPEGRFTRVISQQGRAHDLLVAAGSGITPCLSIAKSVLQDEPNSRVTLLFGNHTIDSMMFRSDIAALKDAHTARFNIINMLSGERQDIARFNGRITGESVTALANDGLLNISSITGAYLCGPMNMVNTVTEALHKLGMNEHQTHHELFTTEVFDKTASKPVRSTETNNKTSASQHRVTIVLDGAQTDIEVDSNNDTVLSAAQRAGIDMPFSCAGGMCCTCRCKVLEGSANMDANFSLAEWEIKAGYMLACQARPSSDKLVLDFDSV